MIFKTAKHYLFSGWLPLLVYLAPYLLFARALLPISTTLNIFVALHLFHLALFALLMVSEFRSDHIERYAFWLALFALCALPGVYLEFPSDPWEHTLRIIRWETTDTFRSAGNWRKWSYFFAWSFLRDVEFLSRRAALTFVSTLWQFLVCFQIYRLARTLGFEERWARLQTVAFLCFFGVSVFGARYYSLAHAMPAYVMYLAALELLISSSRGNLKHLALIPLQLLFIYYNHFQGLIFFLVSTLAVAAVGIWGRLRKTWGLRTALYFTVFVGGVFLALNVFAFIFPLIAMAWIKRLGLAYYFAVIVPFAHTEELLAHMKPMLPVWHGKYNYWNAIGIQGLLTLLYCVWNFRRVPLLAALTLAPTLCMLTPIFVIGLLTTTHYGNTYRVVYAFPFSFAIVVALRDLATRIQPSIRRRGVQLSDFAMTCMMLVLFAIPYGKGFAGRLLYQLYLPPSKLSLADLDPIGEWIEKEGLSRRNCPWLSDDATQFYLDTHFRIRTPYRRLVLSSPLRERHESFSSFLDQGKYCAVLFPAIDTSTIPNSWLGSVSGHWPADWTRNGYYIHPDNILAASQLNPQQWDRRAGPNGAVLYLRRQ